MNNFIFEFNLEKAIDVTAMLRKLHGTNLLDKTLDMLIEEKEK